VGEYPVGGTPTVVSAAAGAVWTINADGQTLSRIDERRRTVRTRAIDSVPLDLAAAPDARGWRPASATDWGTPR